MPDFDSNFWSPAKVFSPSASKTASQAAKDWAYVDSFLVSRYAPNPVPSFERNPDTLRSLLALAQSVEAADEEKLLERRVKEKTLQELQRINAEVENARTERTEPVLSAMEEHMTEEGRRSLNSVALLSVALASSSTDPQRLASHLIDLTRQEHLVAQQTLRIDALTSTLTRLSAELRALHTHLTTHPSHSLSAELPRQIQEQNKRSRVLRHKIEDYNFRLSQGEVKTSVTVQELVEMEKEVAALKEVVVGLEGRRKGYAGLPPEKDLARVEVERVQRELEELESERDRMYDRMVGR